MDPIPPDAFLAGYPDETRAIADRLRAVVRRAVPDAIERVRPGWRLIGYDVPLGRRRAYFAFVAPELEHVHLGFEYGIALADPDRLLEGAHLQLRQVRFVTYRPGDEIPEPALERLTRAAADLAGLPREARLALVGEGFTTSERTGHEPARHDRSSRRTGTQSCRLMAEPATGSERGSRRATTR